MDAREVQLNETRRAVPPAEHDHRSSEEIRRDIVRRRRAADETVDELEERLAPGHLVEEVWDVVKRQVSDGGHAAGVVVRQHPVPVALVGIGLGWLAIESLSGRSLSIEDGEERRDGYGSYDAYAGYDGDAAVVDGGTAAYASEPGRVYPRTGVQEHDDDDEDRSLAGKAKHSLAHGAAEARHRAARYSRRGRHQFWQAMERQPLAVGAMALGLGVIAGLAVPTTEWEDDVMGDASDRLAREARRTASEAVEKGKKVADAAVAGAAREADRQTPGASDLREKVEAVAEEAKRSAWERAEEIDATPEHAKQRVDESRRNVTGEARRSPGTSA